MSSPSIISVCVDSFAIAFDEVVACAMCTAVNNARVCCYCFRM